MTAITDSGELPASLNVTEFHGYPLPPFPPNRFYPQYNGLGQYKLPDPTTGKIKGHTRATTIAKILDDTSQLEKWKMRNVLTGVALSDDVRKRLIAEVSKDEPQAKTLNGLAEDAEIAAGSAESREFGTAVHAWLEAIDLGLVLPIQVPDMFKAHAYHYLKTLARHALTAVPMYVERIVYNSQAKVVGTLDRIYLACDGTLVLGDVKTSKDLKYSYLANSVQLAEYKTADFMLSPDGKTWEPMPTMREDFAVILHCPSGPIDGDPNSDIPGPDKTSAVTFDLTVGKTALDLSLLVKEMRRTAAKTIPNLHAIPFPTAETARKHEAIFAMRTATTPEELGEVAGSYADVMDDDLNAVGFAVYEMLTGS